MGRHRHGSQALDILDDVAYFTAEWIRRLRQTEGDHVPVIPADFGGIHNENTTLIRRSCWCAGGVAVVRQDDELQPGARGSGAPEPVSYTHLTLPTSDLV